MQIDKLSTRDKTASLVLSLMITGIFLFLSIFLLKWSAPNPPLSDSGVALNFGQDDAGWGEIQPELPDAVQAEVPLETPKSDQEDQILTGHDSQSEYEVPPQPDSTPTEPKTPMETPPLTEPQPTTPRAETKNTATPKANNPRNTSNKATNHGDKPGTTGDQGTPQGTLDAKALYGTAGSGGTGGTGTGGSSLDMAGWQWDSSPQVSDQSSEEGRIVFEIRIDETGDIINIATKERTVSPAVEKTYRREIEKLTFSRTATNKTSAPVSVGRIIFIIKSK